MRFALFDPHKESLLYAITDRYGGVSEAPYDTLNLALHVGDDPKNVIENRTLLARKLGFNVQNLIYMEQVHSDRIEEIEHPFYNKISECDALITDRENIPLMVMVADCLPLLFFDPKQKVIAVAHAGRNGTFLGIGAKVAERMIQRYGCRAENILVAIGPGIHSCCYEVGPEIVDIVTKSYGEKYVKKRSGKMFLDLPQMNFDQLMDAGIDAQNIEISACCSCCDEAYFSYRREGTTGRFAGVMMLR